MLQVFKNEDSNVESKYSYSWNHCLIAGGVTPLMIAVRNRAYDKVKMLLQYHDVNAQTHFGITPLMLAVGNNDEKMCEILCNDPSIDVNQKSFLNGTTALLDGCSHGNEKAVRVLLNCKSVEINIQNKLGWTALMYATYQNHVNIVKWLITSPGINVHAKETSGANALTIATLREHIDIVQLLLYKDHSLHLHLDHFPAKRRRIHYDTLLSDVCYRVSIYRGIFPRWSELPDTVVARILMMAFGNEIIVVGPNRGHQQLIEEILLELRYRAEMPETKRLNLCDF